MTHPYSLTAATLFDALQRGGDCPADGTYYLIPGWIGSYRTWSAEHVPVPDGGYEVAYAPAPGFEPAPDGFSFTWGAVLDWESGMRVGVWTDPNTARTYVDLTMHVDCPLPIAGALARQYGQLAIWDWSQGAALTVNEVSDLI